MNPTVLAVTGLQREARAVASPGVRGVVSGGDAAALRGRLNSALATTQIVGVISIGLGGALSPDLHVGDWVTADVVVNDGERFPTDREWSKALASRLRNVVIPDGEADAGPGAERATRGRVFCGPIVGGNVMVTTARAKAALHAATGALAVDMESHVAAGFAAEHGLPFAALRVISDTANRDLPKAVLAGMKPDGGMNLTGVLIALARDPRQLPRLIRTGRDAGVAFRRLALLGGDHLLCGPRIGCPYLGQLLLDVT